MLSETLKKFILNVKSQITFENFRFYINFNIFKIFIHIQLIYDHSNTH